MRSRRPRLVLAGGIAAAAVIAGAPLPDHRDEPVPTTGGPERPLAAPPDPLDDLPVTPAPDDAATDDTTDGDAADGDTPTIQLAFAGDVHFEGAYTGVPALPGSTLGPMSEILTEADLAMVNLESALTLRGEPAAKELEDPTNRFWFRTGPAALDLLARSGVDVVSIANNHGADYGRTGLADTVQAGETGAVAVVGVGRNDRQAYAPHRVRVKGTDVAIHAADASPLESADPTWAAAPGTGLGIASARGPQEATLAAAVARSAQVDDVVIVYLHWGEEFNACPTPVQQDLARTLAEAGADIVLGSHAHTPLGGGLQGSTYVNYGLGNFYWYHGREPDTGVLRLAVRDGEVVGDEWLPGRIPPAGGGPGLLTGDARTEAVNEWHALRGCTGLAPGPGADPAAPAEPPGTPTAADDALPDFASSVEPIGPSVALAMQSHDPATCPVPLTDLRHLVVTHVGFDGRARRGELVVHADVAEDVVGVFQALYESRFPIERMLLVDEYGGDDDLSMANNNTSGYNCRRVAGQQHWSDHAFGRAIDINPVQNPYVVGGEVRPPAAAPFAVVDRSGSTPALPGVITDGDIVRQAFERAGWEWGGDFSDPDYQHFSAPAGP
ncbi:CapA family protein [Jiangella mangrovi]|uniref:Poly-gamma-glutamate synthesis protein (Capsule biosynthesis protein) n=1 Tax=Jiangella mangrovi TaxID=1524084 RepID=A0A7W9LJI2_9ACTN|nr:CapA family protein [Jiangella mangrovi]MBB5786145.1 poly-gamma-glutamate synthesis protein (capsule biosynthesis protein) [Jiangella mangrovi]